MVTCLKETENNLGDKEPTINNEKGKIPLGTYCTQTWHSPVNVHLKKVIFISNGCT